MPQFRHQVSGRRGRIGPNSAGMPGQSLPKPGNTRAQSRQRTRQMKTRRWMITALEEAKKNATEIKLVWARQHRPKRASAAPAKLKAAV
jgi:hypothetical protein